jgi:hypothetical protein
MAAAFLGVAASAICAPLNPAYSRNEFEFYLADLNPKALIVQSGMNSVAIAIAEKFGISVIELVPEAEAAAGSFALTAIGQPLNSDFDFSSRRYRADPTYLWDNFSPQDGSLDPCQPFSVSR